MVLSNIWKLGQVRDMKLGTNVSNKKLLNTAKYQCYSFYRFLVIKKKPTGGVVVNINGKKLIKIPKVQYNRFKFVRGKYNRHL